MDYDKLVEQFGTSRITPELLEKFRTLAGEIHPFFRRGIFYSHRDLDWVLDKYAAGEKFFLYTGRGPSGGVHLGHLIPIVMGRVYLHFGYPVQPMNSPKRPCFFTSPLPQRVHFSSSSSSG